jgi:hypothetical protein
MNTGNLTSDIGELKFTMTSANHVYIEADATVVNRVLYRVTCHVHLIDGEWKLRDYRELYMRRQGSHDDPSPAARKKAVAAILAAWAAYVASASFATVATAAERGHLEKAIERANEEIKELEAKLTLAKANRATLKSKLEDL